MPKVGRKADAFLDSPRHFRNGLLIDAPFGTHYTPQTRVRIVGSRPQMVQDEPPPLPVPADNYNDSPRLKFLENDLTQRLERLEKSVYNGTKEIQSPIPQTPQQRVTAAIRQPSPQQQQQQQQQQQHHHHHHHQQQQLTLPPQNLNPHTLLPPIGKNDNNEENSAFFEEVKLYELLPRDRPLTDRPISLNDEQTTLFYHILSQHCASDDAPKLKDIYLGLVSHDLRMTGFVPFEALRMVFHKHQVFLPLKCLRLLGSMYVSSSGMDMINYERILIFIGAALKNAKNQTLPPTSYKLTDQSSNQLRNPALLPFERPGYYQYGQDDNPSSPGRTPRKSPRRPDIDLHRKLEDKIVCSPRFDVERLRQGFLLADRTHRGTLSPPQIKDVVRSYGGLNLTDSLMDDIIQQCDDCMGQVKWDQFLTHIERVQPLRTGLHIPSSRRPLQHSKRLPTPHDSWPQHVHTAASNEAPAVVVVDRLRLNEGGSGSPLNSPRNAQTSIQNDYSPRMEKWNEIGQKLEHRSKADSLEMRLRDLEENYQKNKAEMLKRQNYGPTELERSMSPMNDNWFARFMKLADALYKNDVDHNGCLKPEEVRWLMGEYNDIYSLNIPLDVQERTMQAARRGDTGLVDIDNIVNLIAKNKMH